MLYMQGDFILFFVTNSEQLSADILNKVYSDDFHLLLNHITIDFIDHFRNHITTLHVNVKGMLTFNFQIATYINFFVHHLKRN